MFTNSIQGIGSIGAQSINLVPGTGLGTSSPARVILYVPQGKYRVALMIEGPLALAVSRLAPITDNTLVLFSGSVRAKAEPRLTGLSKHLYIACDQFRVLSTRETVAPITLTLHGAGYPSLNSTAYPPKEVETGAMFDISLPTFGPGNETDYLTFLLPKEIEPDGISLLKNTDFVRFDASFMFFKTELESIAGMKFNPAVLKIFQWKNFGSSSTTRVEVSSDDLDDGASDDGDPFEDGVEVGATPPAPRRSEVEAILADS